MHDISTKTQLPHEPSGTSARVMLVIFTRGRARVLPMRPGRPETIGRGQRADVVLDDETISREHTRFALDDEGGLWVEDLRSKNGTLVNGRRCGRRKIGAGDKVTIGAASVSVHLDPHTATEIPGVESHDTLRRVLAEQAARVDPVQELTLIVIRRTDPLGEGRQWLQRLVSLTGPYDRVAAYSEREAEVLLQQASAERADSFARSVVATIEEGSTRCGVARLPDAGRTADVLVQAAWTAARHATGEAPIQWADAASHHELVGGERLIVASPRMQRVYATVRSLGKSAIPVLIVGETGAGKELVAQAIHEHSGRSGRMLCVNCAAIPETLIESELFGHERGAFTGASRQAKGVFEEADGGSVFLDEIGELSPGGQAALLRVLENKRLCRVGSKREIAVDVRIITATNRDLEAMCEANTFRSDLLYRINAMVLEIPPLRERREEIAPLARHFADRAAHEWCCAAKTIAPEVMDLLVGHRWSGNVRELRNVVERALALAVGDMIEVQHLPPRILEARVASSTTAELSRMTEVVTGNNGPGATGFRGFIRRTEAALIAAALAATEWKRVTAAEQLGIPLRTMNDRVRACRIDRQYRLDLDLLQALDEAVPPGVAENFKDRIQRYEVALIAWALEACAGRRGDVVRKLGIPARTLREKIRAYSLD